MEVRDTVDRKKNYALVYLLATSELRASEFCSLTWGNIEYKNGKYTAYFIGKGVKEAEQELPDHKAIAAVERYFRPQFGRKPREDDHLFYNSPSFPGDEPQPMDYHALWDRVKKIGIEAQKAGIISKRMNLTPHKLKKTAGKVLDEISTSTVALQHFLRHSNIHKTNRYIVNTHSAGSYLEKLKGENNRRKF